MWRFNQKQIVSLTTKLLTSACINLGLVPQLEDTSPTRDNNIMVVCCSLYPCRIIILSEIFDS